MKMLTMGALAALLSAAPAGAQTTEAPPAAAPMAAPAAAGGGADVSLDELLATRAAVGSSRARPLYATPSTVSIIDRATIERFGFRTLSEALDTVAGMAVTRTTSRTDVVAARSVVPDHYVNKVLLMIDGVAVWNPVVGEAKLSRVALADVERIEVLRGPASVLYGTNAYAGAINVVRRKLDENGTRVTASVGLGDHAETHTDANALLRDGAWSSAITAAITEEVGPRVKVTDSAATPLTGSFPEARNAASFTGSLSYDDEHTVTLQAFKTRETKWGNDALFAGGGLGDPMTYQGYLAVYDFKRKFTDRVSGFARADYDWTDYVFSRAAGFNPRTDVTGWRAGATVGANLELADWVTLEVSGRGEQREAVRYRSFSDAPSVTYAERNGNLTGRKVTEYSAAAQLDFDLFPFAVLAGARYTNNENAGSNFSPRATALWSFTTGQSLKLIAGQSYRAPTLFEQFFLNRAVNPSGYGNPEIKPETATSYEAAYVGQRGGLSWQALGYWAKYEDKIARQPVPDGTVLAGTVCTAGCTMYMNMPGYTAKGVELEGKYSSGAFNAFLAYTYVTTDLTGPQYMPTHKVSVGPSWTGGGLTLSAVANWWSTVDTYAKPGTGVVAEGTIGSQLVVDLTASYEHRFAGTKLRHAVSVKDVADKQIEVPDYVDRTLSSVILNPGRRVFYTLGLSL